MATGNELVDKVRIGAKDPDVDRDEILELLSDGLDDIAGRVLLPALETSATVDTVTTGPEVTMPTSFHRNLFLVKDGARPTADINVKDNRQNMYQKWGHFANTGNVKDVCVTKKDTLLYQPIPASVTTLTLFFHSIPGPVVVDAEPVGFNAVSRRKGERAMVAYAVWRLKETIEQGVDGKKINTTYFHGLYEAALEQLESVISEGQAYREPPVNSGEFL